MKIRQVIELRNKLQKVSNLKGLEVNYIIKKNIRGINDSLVEVIEQEKEVNAIISEFQKELQPILIKASTDSKGVVNQSSQSNGAMSYQIQKDNQEDYKKEYAILEEKYKSEMAEYTEKNIEFNKFLSETDCSFTILTLKKESIPSDIDTENMDLIFDLIED